jgi:glycosyltransferase involved in cell wall biosynthesis
MEGLGLVMVEAMGCGCPVIASDLPAVRDVIRHGETGWLVEPANSSCLGYAVQTLLTQTATRQQLSVQALQTVQNTFDWKTISQNYQHLLNKQAKTATGMEVAHAN